MKFGTLIMSQKGNGTFNLRHPEKEFGIINLRMREELLVASFLLRNFRNQLDELKPILADLMLKQLCETCTSSSLEVNYQ